MSQARRRQLRASSGGSSDVRSKASFPLHNTEARQHQGHLDVTSDVVLNCCYCPSAGVEKVTSNVGLCVVVVKLCIDCDIVYVVCVSCGIKSQVVLRTLPRATGVRYFRNPCDRDPPIGNFKNFKFFKNSLKILSVYFWVTGVYFWGTSVYFWGMSVYFWG